MRCPRCGGTGSFRPDSTWIGTCSKCQGVLLVTLANSPSGGDSAEAPLAPPPAPSAVCLTESFLARYEVLHPIGEGATASVFLGRDRESDQRVAIKFLAQAGKHQVLTRFVREAKLLAGIHHPNVIRLLASGEIEGRPYLVSEYCEGGALRERMSAKRERTPEDALASSILKTPDLGVRMQPREALRLMLAVLAGLEACHAAGIIHRDLKPENILLSGSGEVRLADFGVAREEVSGEPSLTPMGAVIGTPRYMAPEQVRGERATPATDLYAAGAILFEMLAGRPPFVDDRTFELLRSHLDRMPPKLRDAMPELPVALESVVQQALAKAPHNRPATAREFGAQLEKCLRILDGLEADAAEMPVDGPTRSGPDPAVQPPSRAAVWPSILVVIVVGVTVAAARRAPAPDLRPSVAVMAIDPEAALAQRIRLDAAEAAWTRGAHEEARKLYTAALESARTMPVRFQVAVLRSRIERELAAGQRGEAEKLIMAARGIAGVEPDELRLIEDLGKTPVPAR